MQKTSGECCQAPARVGLEGPWGQGCPMHIMTREADGKSRSQGLPGYGYEDRAQTLGK